jgi:alpha-tubulin suppressor-like RCC1 family protein
MGQLGLSDTVSIDTPTQVGTAADWISVSVGIGYNTLALKTDGTLWSWSPALMQIGTDADWSSVSVGNYHNVAIKTDGTLWSIDGMIGLLTPKKIGTDKDWESVSAGGDHTVAIKTDGSLWAWGWNGHGQLGDGTTIDRASPVLIWKP